MRGQMRSAFATGIAIGSFAQERESAFEEIIRARGTVKSAKIGAYGSLLVTSRPWRSTA